MGFLCIVIAYMLRQSMNFALVKIAYPPTPKNVSAAACYAPDAGRITNYAGMELFDWSADDQHLVLGSFYWGYVVTHIPGGLLAQRIGGMNAAIVGTAICAIFTLITPWIIGSLRSFGLLLTVRAIVGGGEGIVFPACSSMLSEWIPLKERTFAVSTVYSGLQMGAFIGAIGSGSLIHAYGWAAPFYVFGIIAIVWCIACVRTGIVKIARSTCRTEPSFIYRPFCARISQPPIG